MQLIFARTFNQHGDLEHVVSIATREDKGSDMALATFRWGPLEEHLAASKASLIVKSSDAATGTYRIAPI